jgi:hypothetical protein
MTKLSHSHWQRQPKCNRDKLKPEASPREAGCGCCSSDLLGGSAVMTSASLSPGAPEPMSDLFDKRVQSND